MKKIIFARMRDSCFTAENRRKRRNGADDFAALGKQRVVVCITRGNGSGVLLNLQGYDLPPGIQQIDSLPESDVPMGGIVMVFNHGHLLLAEAE